MAVEHPSFWKRLFDVSHPSSREEKVISYVCHRLREGAPLEEVLKEDYVRDNCSPKDIEDILRNPRLIHTARESMEHEIHAEEESFRRRR
ncbi:hypothetical protein [Rubrobacter calidifluminis]|uniref:hypothetical protein n=1 Tax=Rubrobacter calidifluminis TaxID=1392640 RepID=UPI00235FC0AC|nr:hypothetical protein [Rubrobacter calidifluminis]